ncbi:hypothetical protein ANO11243_035670 [Dothideomycetidae sp. 11243]|nr:hypothetical protein ANO11243_035670 [fungal sp. No.11243]
MQPDHMNRNSYCDYNGYCYNSGWDSYGRWIVFAVIVGVGICLFFLFSCITARRRRKLGMQPFRGTGWAAGRPPPGHGAATYNPNAGNFQMEQPVYNDPTQQPYNSAPPAYGGYYGNSGVTQPQAAHTGDHYKPPAGPPPAHMS